MINCVVLHFVIVIFYPLADCQQYLYLFRYLRRYLAIQRLAAGMLKIKLDFKHSCS